MRKNINIITLVLAIILVTFLSCEEEVLEPKIETFKISGKLISSINGSDISNIKVELSNDKITILDTTNLLGEFEFENINKGSYNISTNNLFYSTLDTTLFIDSDIETNFYLKELADFLPLKPGNWWSYNFDYRLHQTGYIWQNGNVRWEVWEIDTTLNSIIYLIREKVNATVINKENPDGTIDTSYIENQMNHFELTQNSEGFVRFSAGSFFNRRISIRRYYENDINRKVLVSGSSWSAHINENLIVHDTEFHNITLDKNIGIVRWDIDNSHNGGPDGTLNLVDYEVK